MALFGEKHQALAKWLEDEWWSDGPSVCVISGFPGLGKTEIALQAMEALKRAQPALPMAFFNCVESKTDWTDDLLLTITEELAADGDREPLERLERGEDVAAIFNRLLAPPRLIVADEAQRLLIGSTPAMPKGMASFLERWSQTIEAKGRLLLLTNRAFDLARWNQRLEFRKLEPLEQKEAEAFLVAILDKDGRSGSVSANRLADVVAWLGRNPRAIRLLVSALARNSLDDLIGLAPEAWEARDRYVSPELLRKFEEAILERAEERLEARARVFLRRVSVLRQPADTRVLRALQPDGSDPAPLRDELIARSMLLYRRTRYEMHSVLRDTVRARMTGAERRRAHLAAGRYYSGPFRAKRTLGTAAKLGARFIEARYHFTLAESEADLDDISQRFEAHYRRQFGLTTPVPADPEARDERIALLSALLQARGAKGLEYHLARCLIARDRPGDAGRALPHARRATGPQSPADAWVLRIRLEAREFGSAQAARVAREGAALVAPEHNLFALYQVAGEILARNGKPDEAVEFVRQGIKEVRSEHSLSPLYHLAGEILARDGKPDEAVELLHQGIKEVHPEHNLFSLYQAAGEILALDDKPDEAVDLLHQGIKQVAPEHNLFSLYQSAAHILNLSGRAEEAIDFLVQGIARVPARLGGYRLSEQAINIAFAENLLPKIPADALDPLQADLFAIFAALAQDDPALATRVGTEALTRAGAYVATHVQTAFAWLSLGEPTKADEILRSFPGSLRDSAGMPSTWLGAFIAMERGAAEEASRILGIYLGGGLDPNDAVDRSFLLKLWDAPHGFGQNIAFYFPRLPPRLTGLTRSIVRHQYGGTVLTEEDLRATAEVETLELVAEAGVSALPLPSFDAARVLAAMRPDRWNGLYVLGCYDKTKTVYVQQCRALTLVHALFEAGELRPGSSLGIIGGGAAGVTAAAAAATKGARVILFERAQDLLPLQRRNTTRYLHPHLFDWPASGSTERRAGLPFLDWQADRSNAVAAEIGRGFEEVVRTSGNIEPRLGLTIQDVERVPSADQTNRVQILGAEGDAIETVDVAITAVGFGIEQRKRLGIETPPYWEDDGLDQALGASPEDPLRILVSGAGDGALIDLLRATIRDFRQEDFIDLLPEGDARQTLKDALQAIETRATRNAMASDVRALNLHQCYSELALSPPFLANFRKLVRRDTQVWFNFTSAGRYRLGSSLLNRFLVSVLCHLGAVRPKLAPLDHKAVTIRPDGKYAIIWPRSTEPQIFDRVVVRHGPPGDYLSEVFPQMAVPSAPLRGKLRDLDLTGSLDDATRRFFTAG